VTEEIQEIDMTLEIEETLERDSTEDLPEEETLPRIPSTLVEFITAQMKTIFEENSISSVPL